MGKSVVSKIKYYLPFATEAFSFRLTISIHFFPFVSSKKIKLLGNGISANPWQK